MPGAAGHRAGVTHTLQHLLQLRERGTVYLSVFLYTKMKMCKHPKLKQRLIRLGRVVNVT